MTKKDYIIIANALKPFYQNNEQSREEDKIMIDIIQSISKALKADNPKFNPVKFLDYLRQ